MTEEQPLLRAAWADPENDLPRLVYADWLEEHGRPEQAEFIRLECRAADPATPDGERDSLRRLAYRLRDDAFKAGLTPWAKPFIEFDRGLPTVMAARHAGRRRLWAELPSLTADHGVGDLRGVSHRTREVGRLLRSGVLPELYSLEYGFWGAEDLAELTDSGQTAGLTRLSLRTYEGDDDVVRPLTTTPHLANLRTLSVVLSASVRNLAEADRMPRLRRLSISGTGRWTDWRAALEGPLLGPVEELLVLRWSRANPVARAAAASRRLGGLRRLTLPDGVHEEPAAELAGNDAFAGLESLDLGESKRLTAATVAALAGGGLASLARLNLSNASLGPGGSAALWGSPAAGRIEEINLTRTGMSDDDLTRLARADAARLGSLTLSGNPRVTAAGLKALADAPAAAGLRVLRLAECSLGNAAAEALAGSPHLRGLQHLDLRRNRIWPAGLRALAESPVLAGVRVLDLDGNPIDTKGVEALIASPHLAGVEILSLSGCDLPQGDRRRLRRRFGDAVRM